MRIAQRIEIPPLFFCAMGMWISCALLLNFLQHSSYSIEILVFISALLASATISFCMRKYPSKHATVCVFCILLGLALGAMAASSGALALHSMEEKVQTRRAGNQMFQIIEDVQESSFGQYAIAQAYDKKGNPYKVRVNLPEGTKLSCWDVFETQCRVRTPSQNAAAYYWRKACVGSISPYTLTVQKPQGLVGCMSKLRSAGIAVYSGKSDGALLLKSIVLGERRDLFESNMYGRVKRAGLAHLVAVSGAHVSITLAAVGYVLSLLHVKRKIGAVIQAMVGVLFVVLVGAPHSAVRACIMALCGIGALFSARRPYALNALSVCLIGFFVFDPHASLSLSLALSACATLGIILFSDLFASWFGILCKQRFHKICEVLGMTCAAICCTLPFTAALFGQVSLVAPLANILAAPFFTFLCAGGLVAALIAILFPFMSIPATCMVVCADVFCELVNLVCSIPYAATTTDVSPFIITGLVVLCLVLVYCLWPIPSRSNIAVFAAALFCVCGISFFIFPLSHGTEIIMLDVGQGDAFVLRTGNTAVLVDTGNQDTALLHALARHQVRHLDAVLISHPDDDHCASLSALSDFVEIDKVLVAQDLLSCSCANCIALRAQVGPIPLIGLKRGDSFSWGTFSAKVMWPERFTERGGNDDSLVLDVCIDVDRDDICDARALFCGDAESGVLNHVLGDGLLSHYDIFKVGHHGSSGGVTAEQLSYMVPRIALISVGINNRYGHPAQDTIELLSAQNIAVYRTDKSGDVVCKVEAKKIQIETLR